MVEADQRPLEEPLFAVRVGEGRREVVLRLVSFAEQGVRPVQYGVQPGGDRA
ncbi:hypothetical protein [Streptomyces turgidiscabies]|uniref:Uncharacterized protein n=1 Tax=Streptomyces turgidiscabies TaxID=85558 RepID=A0ABU0RX61_9ACTN|nr:hypothetical protein [Streptomyces turgidiscabies]MDQ0936438.1 hypothetical protein [Streptomyces turgidiscabies]